MKDPDTRTWRQPVTEETLARENHRFIGTGGVSANNYSQGFIPAFLDTETGNVYRSCFPNGTPAPVHMLSGLPDELLDPGGSTNSQPVVKRSVICGFLHEQSFYTRAAAARATAA